MQKKARAALWGAALTMWVIGAAACGKNTGTAETEPKEEVSLAYVVEEVKEAYGSDYLPNTEMDGQMLESVYGIGPEMYEEFIGEVPMISAQADAFLAIRGKEGKGEEIEKALEDYKDALVENAMMYPMNLPIAEAAQIVREGDDVFLVMTGSSQAYGQAETEEEMAKIARGQIEIGVEAIKACY